MFIYIMVPPIFLNSYNLVMLIQWEKINTIGNLVWEMQLNHSKRFQLKKIRIFIIKINNFDKEYLYNIKNIYKSILTSTSSLLNPTTSSHWRREGYNWSSGGTTVPWGSLRFVTNCMLKSFTSFSYKNKKTKIPITFFRNGYFSVKRV